MIRSTPCEYYVKYLIVHPDQYTNESIQNLLQSKRLDYLGASYLESLRARVVPPEVFYPFDKTHAKSQRFLLKEKIYALFHPDAGMREALKILATPRVKEFVESMLISGAPHLAIAQYVTDKLGLYCSESGVKKFAFFFWNMDLVDSSEVRALVIRRAEEAGEAQDKEISKQARAVKLASYKDPRRVAANLPSSPLSALMAQMRMGVMPKELNLAELLTQIRNASLLRALEASLNGGPEDHLSTSMYVSAAKTTAEMLKDLATPETEVLKKISAITIKADESRIPSVKELSGGNHTVEVEKTEDPGTVDDRAKT